MNYICVVFNIEKGSRKIMNINIDGINYEYHYDINLEDEDEELNSYNININGMDVSFEQEKLGYRKYELQFEFDNRDYINIVSKSKKRSIEEYIEAFIKVMHANKNKVYNDINYEVDDSRGNDSRIYEYDIYKKISINGEKYNAFFNYEFYNKNTALTVSINSVSKKDKNKDFMIRTSVKLPIHNISEFDKYVYDNLITKYFGIYFDYKDLF